MWIHTIRWIHSTIWGFIHHMNSCSAGAIPYLWVQLFSSLLAQWTWQTVMIISECVLMCVKYCEEDLFALLLRCWAPLSNGGSRWWDSWIAVSDMHEFMYQHECRLFAMQGQRISWLPMLYNLVTASGSPGFAFWNLLLQGHYCQGIAFWWLCSIW